MKIKGKISKLIAENFSINLDKDYKVNFVEAKKLIVSERIDLIAKYQYVEALDKKLDADFFYEQYKATIEAFSNGRFYEPGDKEKNNFQKFDDTLRELINDISENGFDEDKSVIPITKDGIILDGAHRVAVSAYLNKKVPTVILENTNCNFNYEYFRNRMLDEKYLDNMALKYAEMKKNIYVICLWPTCSKTQQNEISKYIEEKFKVVYEKDVNFSYNGLKNFMSQAYYEQDWIGNLENGYKGVIKKVDLCYKDGRPTHIVVVEEEDVQKIVKEKANIRKKIGIGNHSIHSTDDHIETMRMLELVLNNNSVSFLNNASPYAYKENVKNIRNIKNNENILGLSYMLPLYGLCKNTEKSHDLIEDNSAIYNPESFFYFEGKKIISPKFALDILGKDDARRQKIMQISKDGYKNKTSVSLKRKIRHIEYRLVPLLKKTGLFNVVKKFRKK